MTNMVQWAQKNTTVNLSLSAPSRRIKLDLTVNAQRTISSMLHAYTNL